MEDNILVESSFSYRKKPLTMSDRCSRNKIVRFRSEKHRSYGEPGRRTTSTESNNDDERNSDP